jgi:hypothetical protein
MRADPDATKRVIGDHTVWEIIEAAEEEDFEELDIDTSGFGDFGMEEEEEDEEEDKGPLLSNAAFTVAYGHLLVASHLDYMEDVLATGTRVALIETKDYTRVDNALTGIGAGDNSFRFFARTDKSFQPTYELLRQGKMPEAKTLFGNLLNRIMGPEEEGVLREQRIKGDKLPEFEKVRGYLGPAGSYVRSLDDGWLIEGCVLPKLDDGTEAAGPMVSRQIHDRR